MNSNEKEHLSAEGAGMDYLVAVLRRKEFIIKTTLVVTALAALYSLFVPPVYLAETKILPPQNTGASTAAYFASQMGGAASIPGMKTTNDLYIALLQTRSVADFVGGKLGMAKGGDAKSGPSMLALLNPGLMVRDNRRSGIITIGYMHREPQRAADIANAYAAGLQDINNRLAITEASRRRLFFEEQLKLAKESLIKSEESLKNFQQRTGTIKIDDEAKAAIETVSQLRGRISAKEVDLRVMKSYSTPQNPDIVRLQEEIGALREQLSKLESKSRGEDDSVPTVGKMSALGTEYARKMRESKYNEALYDILMRQFEAARMDEARDAALIQIIEPAVPPEMRLAPERKKIVLKALLFTLLLSAGFVLFQTYYAAVMAEPAARAQMARIKENLDLKQLSQDLKLDVILRKTRGLLRR